MINILMNQRIHRLSKLPDDGDPWAPNNLLTPEQKKNTSWTPVGQVDETVGNFFVSHNTLHILGLMLLMASLITIKRF